MMINSLYGFSMKPLAINKINTSKEGNLPQNSSKSSLPALNKSFLYGYRNVNFTAKHALRYNQALTNKIMNGRLSNEEARQIQWDLLNGGVTNTTGVLQAYGRAIIRDQIKSVSDYEVKAILDNIRQSKNPYVVNVAIKVWGQLAEKGKLRCEQAKYSVPSIIKLFDPDNENRYIAAVKTLGQLASAGLLIKEDISGSLGKIMQGIEPGRSQKMYETTSIAMNQFEEAGIFTEDDYQTARLKDNRDRLAA